MLVKNGLNLCIAEPSRAGRGRGGPREGSEDMDTSTKYVWEVELTRRTSELWAEDFLPTDLCCDDGIVRYTIRA